MKKGGKFNAIVERALNLFVYNAKPWNEQGSSYYSGMSSDMTVDQNDFEIISQVTYYSKPFEPNVW